MQLKNKNVMIVGLARSGLASARILHRLGANIIINDTKTFEQLSEAVASLEELNVKFVLGREPGKDILMDTDLMILSPGVPKDKPFIGKAFSSGVEVISEVELAYRLCSAPIIAITGTNGKTTTTALTGRIFEDAGINSVVAGNIGVPLISHAVDMERDGVIIAEISSFQLESVRYFKPRIAVVLNITEDHLDRHKTMENYIWSKMNITFRQTWEDYIVLNADDENVRRFKSYTRAKTVLFSIKKRLDQGVFIENGIIKIKHMNKCIDVCSVDDICLKGLHNRENVLAAVSISWLWGIDIKTIAASLKAFKGVEHRLEFVKRIRGIDFYNDSKGTNPDSSIKALQAIDGPIILIAGGMDKGSDFYDFLKSGRGKIKGIIVLGETTDKIVRTALDLGFENIEKVNSIQQAVRKGFESGTNGDTVLLSPACASWDMFSSFEERGRVFKDAVHEIGR